MSGKRRNDRALFQRHRLFGRGVEHGDDLFGGNLADFLHAPKHPVAELLIPSSRFVGLMIHPLFTDR